MPDDLPGATEFERVVLPHLDAAHNLARWLVGDPALAEDSCRTGGARPDYFGSYRGGDARRMVSPDRTQPLLYGARRETTRRNHKPGWRGRRTRRMTSRHASAGSGG